jgi:hypothetical protein
VWSSQQSLASKLEVADELLLDLIDEGFHEHSSLCYDLSCLVVDWLATGLGFFYLASPRNTRVGRASSSTWMGEMARRYKSSNCILGLVDAFTASYAWINHTPNLRQHDYYTPSFNTVEQRQARPADEIRMFRHPH